MPKTKRHSGAKKTFKLTGSGKVLRRRAMRGHLLGKKTSKRKRGFRKSEEVRAEHVPAIKKLLGKG
jgi:large subunit ribosomal protein L35